MASFIQACTVHRFDLAFFHPDSIGVIANWSPEQFVPVDEMRPVNTGSYLDHDGTVLGGLSPEAVDF